MVSIHNRELQMVYYACFFFTVGLVDTVHPVVKSEPIKPIYSITAPCDSLPLDLIANAYTVVSFLSIIGHMAELV